MVCLYSSGIRTDVYSSEHSIDISYLKWAKYKQKGMLEGKTITMHWKKKNYPQWLLLEAIYTISS